MLLCIARLSRIIHNIQDSKFLTFDFQNRLLYNHYMDIPSISPTSTKAEILYAFNKLRSLIDSQKQTKDMPFRARVISALEDIETTLAQKTEEIVQLEKQMGQLTNKLDLGKKAVLTQETLQNLQDRIIMEEKGWERRKRQLEQELKEEAEFAKKRLQKELDERP